LRRAADDVALLLVVERSLSNVESAGLEELVTCIGADRGSG
jgi:hypothetical protein